MPIIKVLLQSDERDALEKLANTERRDPRAQAAIIIRKSLEQTGYLINGLMTNKSKVFSKENKNGS